MPKPPKYIAPAYGSPEWKAMRAQMVGTPEWRNDQHLATPDENIKFRTDEYIQNWINDEIRQGHDRPTADQIASKRSGIESQFRTTFSPSNDPQDQKMMTGANVLWRTNDQGEKEFYYGTNPLRQDAPHSELYNRLLQSGGLKEGIPIDPWSPGGKFNPNPVQQPATNNMPIIQGGFTGGTTVGSNVPVTNPNTGTQTQPQNPYIQYPYYGTQQQYRPSIVNSGNPNPISPPANIGSLTSISPQTSNASNSGAQHVGAIPPQMIGQAPSLNPSVSVPQGNAQPKIELPDAFKVNSQISGPNLMPPLSIRNGITMPAVTPGVKPQSFPSMNWSDLLTIAHTR